MTSHPSVALIVQARTGSSRLPGKVLAPILGEPMLRRVLERLERTDVAARLVVATTALERDDPVADVAAAAGAEVFRGDEADVLDRYYRAARRVGADVVVRITADCPLIDPEIVTRCVDAFRGGGPGLAYVSTGIDSTFPRGLDTEVVAFEALEAAHREATEPADREHVTPFIWRQPERFPALEVSAPRDLGRMRWTVDTAADLEFVRRVYEALHPRDPAFGHRDVLALLERRPQLQAINAHVPQKAYGE